MLYLLTVWLFVQFISFICLPLSSKLFSSLPDRGYSLNKSFALILSAYLVWLAVSLHLLPFTRDSILIVGLIISLISVILSLTNFINHKSHSKHPKIRYYLFVEIIFFSLFIFFAYLKYRTPAISGTEKPMDLALINGIFRSRFFPPNDAWYANASINYYYYGHYLVAFVSKLTAIPTRITYNLALPLIFSLSGLNIFGLVANYAKQKKRIYLLALIALALILIGGNLDTATQSIKSDFQKIGGEISWWNPSRVIGRSFFANNNGYLTITEFPYFSLLLGDVHAHVLALLFGTFFMGVCLSFHKNARYHTLIVGSLVLANLGMTNPWEIPGYLLVALLLLIFAPRDRFRLGLTGATFLMIFSFLFLAHYQVITPANDPKPFINFIRNEVEIGRRTLLPEFATVWATQLLFILTALMMVFRKLPANQNRLIRIIVGLGLITFFGFGYLSNSGVVFPLGILIVILLICLANRSLVERSNLFPFFLVIPGVVSLVFCELFFINDLFTAPLERMNTVFKFYFFSWTILGAGSVLLLSDHLEVFIRYKVISVLALLFLAGNSAYFFLATPARLAEFSQKDAGFDGLKYLSLGTSANRADLATIDWLNQNVVDSVNIVESAADPSGSTSYNSIGRISAATGLPTILGWVNGHEEGLWRSDGQEIASRNNDVRTIYESSDLQTVKKLLQKYSVKYIVIGQQEKSAYPKGKFEKFSQLGNLVFTAGLTEIYRVF